MATRLRPQPAFAPARPRHPRQAALHDAALAVFDRAEAAIVVAGFFLFSTAMSPILAGAESDPTAENATLRTVYTSVYIVLFPWILVHWKEVLAAATHNVWTMALVGLGVVSTAWSVAPDVTQRRGVAWVLTTLFGVYLAARFDTRTLLKLLAAALGLAAVMSALFAIALPAYGVHSQLHAGAWRGVYPQKNTLGQVMVLGTVVFMVLRPSLGRWRWVGTCGAALCAALVLASTSKTALVILATMGALTVLFRSLRWHFTLAVPFMIGCVMVGGSMALWLAARAEGLLTAMGKDPTLTGRTPMWEVVWDMIMRRAALGYGYSAFWVSGPNSPAREVAQVLEWETPHAHNGFLDLGLQVGLIGVALFFVGFAVAAVRGVKLLRSTPDALGMWPILFLSFILLYNMTESGLGARHNLFWVLYAATVCSWTLRRPGTETRAVAQPGPPPVHAHAGARP
jgi:O-antigen ligase